MTDELKDKFRALVADAPPPSGVPSEAVFERIRTARRRRTTGAVAGAAATAVAAITLATGNLTGVDSAPPVIHTPTPTPVVTGSPTPSPTPAPRPSRRPSNPKPTGAGTLTTPPPADPGTDEPPPRDPSPDPSRTTRTTETPPAVDLKLALTPRVDGLKLTVEWRWSGSVLAPVSTFTGKTVDAGSRLSANAYNWGYDWGDGRYESPSGQNGGGLTCDGASRRVSGSWRDRTETHTYLKPGTYTFSYVIGYCGPNGLVNLRKTVKIAVTGATSTATP